jgi:hypothetical protein
MAELSGLLLVVVILALLFDFSNGWHDSANAIATVVSTRVVSPSTAVLVAGVLNVAGAFMSTAVAKMVGTGIVDPQSVTQAVVASALGRGDCVEFCDPVTGTSDQLFSCADRGAGRCCVDPRRHGGRQVLGPALGA